MTRAGIPVGGTATDVAEGRALVAFSPAASALAEAAALTLVALFVPGVLADAVIGRTADEALVTLRETAHADLPRFALPARARLGLVEAGDGPVADSYYAAAAPFALTPFALGDSRDNLDAVLVPNADPWRAWALASRLSLLAVPADPGRGVILCGAAPGLLAAIGDAIHRASGVSGPRGQPLTAPLPPERAPDGGVDRTGMNGRG